MRAPAPLLSIVLLLALPMARAALADRSAAADFFKRGMAAFALEDWDGAIAEFDKGFRQEPRPEFLFNIAQSHREAGRYEQAIRFYQRYLDLKPDARDRPEVERQIGTLRASLATRKRVEAAAPVLEPGPAPRRPVPLTPPRPPLQEAPRGSSLGVGLVAAGAAIAAAGIGLAVYGSIAAGTATDPQTSTDLAERERALAGANAASVSGYVAIGVGAALLVGGAVALARRPRPAVVIGVAASPGGFAAAMGGRF